MVLDGIPIPDNQCIGDSLQYLNNAFLTLSSKEEEINNTVTSNAALVPTTPLTVTNSSTVNLFYNNTTKTLSAVATFTAFSAASADETLTYDAVQQKWVDQRPFPTWNSTPATSAQNLQLSSVSGNGFANWQRALTDVIRNNRDTLGDRVSAVSGTYPGAVAFDGGVLLKDGRVFCVPFNATQGYIYDPNSNSVSTTAAGSFPGNGAFAGGVLLPDGRVFCIPAYSQTARIYDPVTGNVTTPSGSFHSLVNQTAFSGGVLLPDGKVLCIPGVSQTARIYDPASGAITTPAQSFHSLSIGSAVFEGGCLMPNGKVFVVPSNTSNAKIYDPVSQSVTNAGGSYGSGGFEGAVLLPNGKVFVVPNTSTTARIYDPITDTATVPNGTYPTCLGGLLLPNGNVLCIPTTSAFAKIYNPILDIVITSSLTNSQTFRGGVLLPNGKVFIVPRDSTTARIYDPTDSYQPITLDMNFVTSPFVNKY